MEARVASPRLRLGVVPEDPAHDRILECAAESGADYLVTGDAHLLAAGQFRDTRIVTARGFVAVLAADQG